ncbi:MAG: putative motility protein [Nitrospirae bacterium]|nr:putative motility protein [Nitrospirota bacterium]
MEDLITAALAMNQSRLSEQIAMSVMKSNAEAGQAVANMLIENARRIAEISKQAAARGGIDIYV